MNRIALSIAAGIVLTGAAARIVQAGFEIEWDTIDGGGGSSTGGVYAIHGTIGQPDADAPNQSGAQYGFSGGFWALFALPPAGRPVLRIAPNGLGQATISWQPDASGWVLQQTETLIPSAWSNAPSGPTNPVVVPATLPSMFYRAVKP